MDMVYFDGLEGMGNGGGPPGIAERMRTEDRCGSLAESARRS